MTQEVCTQSNDYVTPDTEICCPSKAAGLIGGIIQSARVSQIGTIFQIDLDDASELDVEIGGKLFRLTITDATGDYPDRSGTMEGGAA
jgi:hypothetical protein